MAQALMVVAMLALLAGSDGNGAGGGGLQINISSLPDDSAPVVVAVFDNKSDFGRRSNAVASLVTSAAKGAIQWHLQPLPPGDYAVLAFQDLNGNRQFDMDDKGRPQEPFTASGRLGRRAPRFDLARVAVQQVPLEVSLSQWRFRRR